MELQFGIWSCIDGLDILLGDDSCCLSWLGLALDIPYDETTLFSLFYFIGRPLGELTRTQWIEGIELRDRWIGREGEVRDQGECWRTGT
jgi:hypothetical protein